MGMQLCQRALRRAARMRDRDGRLRCLGSLAQPDSIDAQTAEDLGHAAVELVDVRAQHEQQLADEHRPVGEALSPSAWPMTTPPPGSGFHCAMATVVARVTSMISMLGRVRKPNMDVRRAVPAPGVACARDC